MPIYDNKKICISAVATHYSEKTYTIEQLIVNARMHEINAEMIGINQVHVTENGILTTSEATIAANKALQYAKIIPEKIDELVYISEGMGDYLYMDTSKSVLRNIQGRTDGEVYTYDICRGNNGTIGVIKMVANQLVGNKRISTALISSALLWENHSQDRWLGATFLGDGAGAIILQENIGNNEILSMACDSISECNLVSGFKYGGTKYDLPKEALKNGEFFYGILDEDHLQKVIDNVVSKCINVGYNALERAGLSLEDIDCIGIAGFSKKHNTEILHAFPRVDIVIDPLSEKGFLGTLGVIEIFDKFINDDSYEQGAIILIIANGIDSNVEAIIIRK